MWSYSSNRNKFNGKTFPANTRERRLINMGKEISAAGTLRIPYDDNQMMNIVVTVDIAGMASVYAYNGDTIKVFRTLIHFDIM